jgi:hypothetical protein
MFKLIAAAAIGVCVLGLVVLTLSVEIAEQLVEQPNGRAYDRES